MNLEDFENNLRGCEYFREHIPADKVFALPSGREVRIVYAKGADNNRLYENGKESFVIVVLPGGGYEFTSYREGLVIARAFNRLGFSAAVLNYSTELLQNTEKHHKGLMLQPAAETCELIRTLRTDPSLGFENAKIVLCGFSAGGHLASTVCTKFKDPALLNMLGDGVSVRPDGAILCYPVISGDPLYTHKSSMTVLTGGTYSDKWDYFSSDKFVDKDTPPAFVWHTANDELVSVQNSLLYAQAMWKCGNIASLMVYPDGLHGTTLSTDEVEPGDTPFRLSEPYRTTWAERACAFVRRYV